MPVAQAAYFLSLPPDTIYTILSQIPEHPSRRGSLAPLARTCRELWKPVVTILWRTLPSFTVMLFTLPADLFVERPWAEGHEPLIGNVLRHSRPRVLRDPRVEDFKRWKVYAQLVYSLSYDPGPGPQLYLPCAAWMSLVRHGPNPLLPNLRRLAADDLDILYLSSNELSFPFPARKLRCLNLYISEAGADLPGLLDKLAAADPLQLEVLVVNQTNPRYGSATQRAPTRDLNKALEGCFRATYRLRELQLGYNLRITPATLTSIGSLRSLEVLSISRLRAPTPTPSHESHDGGALDAFPSLRRIHIVVGDMRWVSIFIPQITSPRLEMISLGCRDTIMSSSSVTDFFNAVGGHCSRTTIKSLLIHSVILDGSLRQPPCDLSEAVRPLLSLSRLAFFSMSGWAALTIADRTIEAMAIAWPELERIELEPHFQMRTDPPSFPATSITTLPGLVPLAQRCPKLSVLALHVNFNFPVPLPIPDHAARVAHSQLRILHVGSARPPQDPVSCAAFLSHHFPMLARVDHSYGRVGVEVEQLEGPVWSEVGSLLRHFRLIHVQERRWAKGSSRELLRESSI
ncbi:hypothetical protein K466DRAFT_663109 [Polyporus arcularius HHB13444]|uniref:F-box domain-containing protein n=1 Tax=Polyporus arcularius HHB13444 TaxID=1314778 RepID=A0A5C3PGI6_9APHY|nr:hypothetical protein K466DRAFT_663109 [Polyporus arcularius HHB13444]